MLPPGDQLTEYMVLSSADTLRNEFSNCLSWSLEDKDASTCITAKCSSVDPNFLIL